MQIADADDEVDVDVDSLSLVHGKILILGG